MGLIRQGGKRARGFPAIERPLDQSEGKSKLIVLHAGFAGELRDFILELSLDETAQVSFGFGSLVWHNSFPRFYWFLSEI